MVNYHNMGTNMSAIDKAIKKAGNQSALSRLIGVAQQNISYWVKNNQVPASFVLKIEKETGISRHELRPDLYPLEDIKQAS